MMAFERALGIAYGTLLACIIMRGRHDIERAPGDSGEISSIGVVLASVFD